MNYRHAYHAGNHGDVLKHVVLARLIAFLHEKPSPVFILDTHAGIGAYDLTATEDGGVGNRNRSPVRPPGPRAGAVPVDRRQP